MRIISKSAHFISIALIGIAAVACSSDERSPVDSASDDTTPPTISSTYPANNATGVAANVVITANVSEPLDASTVSTATFALNGVTGSSEVAGLVTFSGTTATFTPLTDLAYSTSYTATITSVVKDLAGNAMVRNYSWSFTTGEAPDTTPPTVLFTNPASDATGFAVNGAITATFSEIVSASTLTTSTFTLNKGVTGAVTLSGTTATFVPSTNLAYSTAYSATITTGVKDVAGNAMVGNHTWSFTTGVAPDTTPPTIVSTQPAHNATGVKVNSPITATFSEVMAASTFTTASFTLNNGVTGAVTYSGMAATFSPLAVLSVSTPYIATITSGVKDSAGNAMESNYSWSFTTGEAPPIPPVGSGLRKLTVSPTGSSTSDCISVPCTIQRAVRDVALPGDTIEVRAGTYDRIEIRRWGTADHWIFLRAAPGESVVIRGSTPYPSVNFYDSGCDEYAPAGSVCPSAFWHIDGITVMGSATGGADGNAIKIDLSDVTITNSKLCCSYSDIIKAVRTANRVTIYHNELWHDPAVTPKSNNAQGIDKTGGSDLRVIGNYFHDINDIAVYAKGNACRPLISGNLFFNTGTNLGGSTVMLGQQTDATRLVKGCGDTTSTYYESYDGVAKDNLIINAQGGCLGVSSSHNALVLNNTCVNTGTAEGGRAAFYLTNESVADPRPGYPNGRQPSDYVEFRGNKVQNVQGKIFTDSDNLAIDDWSNLVMVDNVYYATSPLWFKLAPSSTIYNGGTFAQWNAAYTELSGRTDNSSTSNPLLDPDALKAEWLARFYAP